MHTKQVQHTRENTKQENTFNTREKGHKNEESAQQKSNRNNR